MLDKIASFAERHRMFPPGGLVLAAVSGGADSVCLLLALLELAERLGISVAAAHFNHNLRGPESDRDALFVERFCRERNVPLFSGGADVKAYAAERHLGIEQAARKLRYDFLHEAARRAGAERIATAHTANDNAETIILNLVRGSGLKGLCGIPPVRGIVVRPMLEVTRDEVEAFLAKRGAPYVEDSTNSLDFCSRNIVRHRVIPVLNELNPRFVESAAAAAALLREDEECLSEMAERFIGENFSGSSVGAEELFSLPYAVKSRAVRLAAPHALSSKHVEAILDLCRPGVSSGEVHTPAGPVRRECGRIVFGDAVVPAGFAPVELQPGKSSLIPELGLEVACETAVCQENINKSFTTFLFKCDNICGKIVVRPRRSGDAISLFGRGVTKSLKKLFIELKIPRSRRPLVPVIADERGVLGVYGVGIDSRAACSAGDAALQITFRETCNAKRH